MRAFTRGGCEPPRANVAAPVLASPGRSSRPAPRRNGRSAGSSGGKRRPEPHGHKSFRPSFSTSSVSMPTIRLPRLTRDSLEGTPGGACQTAQKDASVSWSRYMIVLPGRSGQEDRSRCGAGAASRFPPERTPGHVRAPSGMAGRSRAGRRYMNVSVETACELMHKVFPRKRRGPGGQKYDHRPQRSVRGG